jgi:hypothetical protein
MGRDGTRPARRSRETTQVTDVEVGFVLPLTLGAIALVLFTSQWLLRKLFYRLGSRPAVALRYTAAFEQTTRVLIWIGTLAWAWMVVLALHHENAAHLLGYLAEAVLTSAAVVLGLWALVTWLSVKGDDRG